MELYIKVSFWLGFVAQIIRFCEMLACDYPRKKPSESLGQAVALFLFTGGFMIWAGLLLWHK